MNGIGVDAARHVLDRRPRELAAEGQVLRDGAGEEHDVLEHQADVAPQRDQVPLAHVDALHEHGAALDVVGPGEEPRERRLPRPGGADDRDPLAGLDAKRDSAERPRGISTAPGGSSGFPPARSGRIGEPDVPELDGRQAAVPVPRAGPRPAAALGAAVPPASAGVSSSAKTRSAATVAACMTENFADASRIGR